MKKSITFWLLALMVTSTLLVHCKKDKETQFIILVDSILVADTITVGEDLVIEFFGTIGNDGCHSFSHVEDNSEGNVLAFTMYGVNSGAKECPDVIVKLDGTTITVSNLTQGDYTIEITQPDQSVLTETFFVKPSGT